MNPWLEVETNADALMKLIPIYRTKSGKTSREAMSKHCSELATNLFLRFLKIVPTEEEILRDVRKAGWKLRVGIIAKRLAEKTMGGLNMSWGTIYRDAPGGLGTLRLLRIGKRGRPIIGGRHGRLGRAATEQEGKLWSTQSQISRTVGYYTTKRRKADGTYRFFTKTRSKKEWVAGGDALAKDKRRINRREVSIFMETMLRLRGRRSLAVSWRHGRSRFVIQRMINKGIGARVMTNSKAELPLHGKAAYGERFTTNGMIAQFDIASMVPGTKKFPRIISKAVRDTSYNILVYLQRKLPKDIYDSLHQSVMKTPFRKL